MSSMGVIGIWISCPGIFFKGRSPGRVSDSRADDASWPMGTPAPYRDPISDRASGPGHGLRVALLVAVAGGRAVATGGSRERRVAAGPDDGPSRQLLALLGLSLEPLDIRPSDLGLELDLLRRLVGGQDLSAPDEVSLAVHIQD